jgi:hypothetical protein
MSRQKLSRLAARVGAAVVVTFTCAVVARAQGFFVFIAAPSAFSFSFSLPPGGVSGCVTPIAGIPNQLIGEDTTPGTCGVGEVSLLRINGTFLGWVGLESPLSAAITSDFSGSPGTHIVFIDLAHTTKIEVCTADSYRVHNKSTITHTGVVDLWY